MSDSWILIGLTILIVFLLFYMSKRLICSGPILTNSNEENGETGGDCPLQCDNEMESRDGLKSICHSSSNNNLADYKIQLSNNSHVENRLRLQIFNMILAERKYEQLESEVHRLASLLAFDQGTNSAEDCIKNLRNELYPLTTVNSFQSQLFNGGRLPKYQHSIDFNDIVNIVDEINFGGRGGEQFISSNNSNPPDVICHPTTEESHNNSSIPNYNRLRDDSQGQGCLTESVSQNNQMSSTESTVEQPQPQGLETLPSSDLNPPIDLKIDKSDGGGEEES